jgi:amino acid efflux transporter
VQFALTAALVAVVLVALGTVLPGRADEHWEPFAPHGWRAVGTAANILAWLFFGWEAMAQMAGEFRDPRRDLPRAVALAYVTVGVLYVGLAVASITVVTGTSRVPLADLLEVGLGSAGRDATALLAVLLTMGTMSVYLGGSSKLAAALAQQGGPPAWLGAEARRSIPRRPLAALAVAGAAMLGLPRGRPDGARGPGPRDLGVLRRRLRPLPGLGDPDPRRPGHGRPPRWPSRSSPS